MESDEALINHDIGRPVALDRLGVGQIFHKIEFDGNASLAQSLNGGDDVLGALEMTVIGRMKDPQRPG
ncbi:MAG: hypothetical protein D6695_06940 [Planctomycetota bacterium]|nr:MAG: hypothetical protein D6695_06940 [Planctomycetota bacterium]